MKRIASLIVVAMVLCVMGTAFAADYRYEKWTLVIDDPVTGVTTASKRTNTSVASGVSEFMEFSTSGVSTTSGVSIFDLGEDAVAPYLSVAIVASGISPSQAAKALGSGTYSGTTFAILYSTSHEREDLVKNTQEKIPVFYRDALSSGITPYHRPAQLPFTRYVKFYFQPSGIYAFDGAKIVVTAGGNAAAWLPPQLIVISEGTFTMPASTGTSTFSSVVSSFDGVRYGEFSLAGSSRFYTTDGTTPTIDNNGMHCADLNGFSLTGNEIRALKLVGSSSACKVHYKLLNAKP